jgi:hypothetical protein
MDGGTLEVVKVRIATAFTLVFTALAVVSVESGSAVRRSRNVVHIHALG